MFYCLVKIEEVCVVLELWQAFVITLIGGVVVTAMAYPLIVRLVCWWENDA